MTNSIIVVTEEFLKRVFVGLGEIPSKFAHQVILDFEAQLNMAKEDTKKFVSFIEEHLAPHKAEIALQEAKVAAAVAAAAEEVTSRLSTAAKEVVADVAAAV